MGPRIALPTSQLQQLRGCHPGFVWPERSTGVVCQQNALLSLVMPRHETVTDDYVDELRAGLRAQVDAPNQGW
jgi:hypothetical protein